MTSTASDDTRTPTERLVRQLYGLGAVRRELARIAAGELTTPGFGALVAVHRGEATRVGEVAAVLQVDQSVASRQIAGLEAAGYVERTPDPDDRRAHLLAATPAGCEAIGSVHRTLIGRLDQALGSWDEADVIALASGLERLLADFDAGASR